MSYFTDPAEFDKQMGILKRILKAKGCVLESDHPYAYSMQHGEAFTEVSDWLYKHGYEGKLETHGHFFEMSGAVYGLYDADRITFEKMSKLLEKEAKRQAGM